MWDTLYVEWENKPWFLPREWLYFIEQKDFIRVTFFSLATLETHFDSNWENLSVW